MSHSSVLQSTILPIDLSKMLGLRLRITKRNAEDASTSRVLEKGRRRVNIHTLMPTLESMSIKMIYVCHVMCPDVRARAKLVESVMESRNP